MFSPQASSSSSSPPKRKYENSPGALFVRSQRLKKTPGISSKLPLKTRLPVSTFRKPPKKPKRKLSPFSVNPSSFFSFFISLPRKPKRAKLLFTYVPLPLHFFNQSFRSLNCLSVVFLSFLKTQRDPK
ncbi:hypothetical protein I3843_13G104000 [Carya illinoinensis]|nr:hypothetical protein I3843_13G104000 [Carya illinoinensis]